MLQELVLFELYSNWSIEHVALPPTTGNVSPLCACRPAEEEEFYDSFEVGDDHEFEHVDPLTDRQAAPANEMSVVQSADHHVTGSAVIVSLQEALSRIHGNLQLILQRLNGLEEAVKAEQRQRSVSTLRELRIKWRAGFEWSWMKYPSSTPLLPPPPPSPHTAGEKTWLHPQCPARALELLPPTGCVAVRVHLCDKDHSQTSPQELAT